MPATSEEFRDNDSESSAMMPDAAFLDDSESDSFSAYDFSNMEDELDRLFENANVQFKSALAPQVAEEIEIEKTEIFDSLDVDTIMAKISAELTAPKQSDENRVKNYLDVSFTT